MEGDLIWNGIRWRELKKDSDKGKEKELIELKKDVKEKDIRIEVREGLR